MRTRIASVRAVALDLELTESFGIATGSQERLANVLVAVELESGEIGLGEAAPLPAASGETQASTLAAIEELIPVAVGADAARIRPFAAALAGRAKEAPAARAALEMAAMDAAARAFGYPLWQAFGGALEPLETDMTIVTGSVRHAAESARAIALRGIGALKIKVGAFSPADDVERVAAAHAAAPEATILADANGAWTSEKALAFALGLERRGIELGAFEQPVPATDLEGLREVQLGIAAPVVADESVRSAADAIVIARFGAARGINVKVQKTGVVEALDVIAVARAAGIDLMIGGMVETVLSMTFSACLASGQGGFRWVDLDTPMFVRAHPFSGGFVQTGGRIDLARVERGHGVTIAPRSVDFPALRGIIRTAS